MRGVLQQRRVSATARGHRETSWIRLREPYVFNRFHFLVEVRAGGCRPARPLGESDVRIRGPLCMKCGAPMTAIESAPNYERYACRRGEQHCEYWVGRVNHQGFSEFVAEHLRPVVYRALLDGHLQMSPQSVARVRTRAAHERQTGT